MTVALCRICGGPTHPDVRDGCTPHTCTTACADCGHPGQSHRDWYRQARGTGFCRICPEGQPARLHDYTTEK